MGEYRAGNGTRANPIKFVINDAKAGCAAATEGGNPGFTAAAGRIGDIEALNGATKGLNAFVSTTRVLGPNAERLIDGSAESGLSFILGAGGAKSGIDFVNNISPSAVNKGVFAVQSLQDKAKQGNLDYTDIPAVTRDVANVFKIANNIYNPDKDPSEKLIPVCSAPNYATDLVNFGVKHNYRYVIKIDFNSPFSESLGLLNCTFGLISCDRPSVTIEHEDVNMYNYRTKVPKKVNYDPITIEFYDDQWSQALDFYTMYLKTISPIANMKDQGQFYTERTLDYGTSASVKGGNTKEGSHSTIVNSSSLGSFGIDAPGSINIIEKITIYHLYRGGGLLDEYAIYNPKATEMKLDNLDSKGGDTGKVSITFAYDSVYIDTFKITDNLFHKIEIASSGGGRGFTPIYPIIDTMLPDDFIGKPGDEFDIAEQKTEEPKVGFLERTSKWLSGL